MNIITANRLLDGAVIYRTPDGGWAERFEDCARFSKEESARALEEAACDVTLVVNPYLVALEDAHTFIKRERNRETIRARGPTIGWNARAEPQTGEGERGQ